MRQAVSLAVAALCVVAAATPSRATPARTVPCGDAIAFPDVPADGDRVILGAVSVPLLPIGQVVRRTTGRWRYWRKWGLVLSGRERVTVTVPARWRDRVAITWGSARGAYTSIAFAGCPNVDGVGRAFAGGFLLRAPAACVPLAVRVGARTAIARFGVGSTC